LFPDISAAPRAMLGNTLLEQQKGPVKIINLNVSWLSNLWSGHERDIGDV
jgi:hypothetical protein